MPTVKERHGASWVADSGDGGELSLLWAEAQAKEETGGEMRAWERTVKRWGCDGTSWPDMA